MRRAGRLFAWRGQAEASDEAVPDDERFADDQEALQRFRAGDIGAYGELFARYRSVAVGYARRYTNSSPDAEDLAQDAFARVLQALVGGKGPTVSMRHYLLTSIRAIATDGFRRKAPREFTTEPEVLAALYEREHFEDEHELADWVVEGFNSLTDRQQQIVWNHAVEGRSLTSLAPELHISVASASRDYGKAMMSLRRSFADSAAHASGDPDCERFSSVLGERATRRSPELSEHVSSCASCSAVMKRLHAQDRVLMSLVVVAGLGGFGLEALRPASTAAAATTWISGLSGATKALTAGAITICAIAIVATALMLVQRSGSTTVIDGAPLASAAADGSVIVSTASCDLRREVAGERREVWQLIGDESCAVSVERVGHGAGSASLLNSSGVGGARGVEIVRTGEYRVHLRGPDGASRAVVRIPVGDR